MQPFPRPFPNCLARHVRDLSGSTLQHLIQSFGQRVALETPPRGARRRDYPMEVTFWGFLFQVLCAGASCRSAVQQIQSLRLFLRKRHASGSCSAYCQARARLPLGELWRLARRIGRDLEDRTRPSDRWMGRAVRVVDATSASMPDTPANQRRWPQPGGQKPGCGFPVLKLAALFSLSSGALLAAVTSPLNFYDGRLLSRLLRFLLPGDVLLGDRAFCSFANIAELQRHGVDAVLRLHQARKLSPIKRLGKNDSLIRWSKPIQRTPSMSRSLFERLPGQLFLRHVRFHIAIPGFRTRSVELVTTLLDPAAFPAISLAELFRQRWQAELNFRHIKTTMGMEVLRCQSPSMIKRELAMHLIAYNLVRSLIFEAAVRHRRPIAQLSFKGSVDLLRHTTWLFLATPTSRHPRFRRLLLRLIAQDTLPLRPNRVQPRVVKRRPKPYQLLSKPRHLMRETPHRDKYRKPLS